MKKIIALLLFSKLSFAMEVSYEDKISWATGELHQAGIDFYKVKNVEFPCSIEYLISTNSNDFPNLRMENIMPKKHEKFCNYTKRYIEESWGNILDRFSKNSKKLWATHALKANNISFENIFNVSIPCSIDYQERKYFDGYSIDIPRNFTPPEHDLFCETVEKYKKEAYEDFKKYTPTKNKI
jgi:hypothetical protein